MRHGERTLHLEEWQRLRTRIFWCYEGHPPATAGVTRYRTPNYSLWIMRRGEGTLYGEGSPLKLHPGDCVLVVPPSHVRHFTEDARILSVHFRVSWVDDIDLFTLSHPVIFPRERQAALERIANRLLRFFHSFGPRTQLQSLNEELTLSQYLHFQTLSGRFALTLTDMLDAEGLLPSSRFDRPDPQLARILARLRDLPLERPWSSAETARGLNMSTGHFNRVFRLAFGQTPRRYFDSRRLEHAKQGVVAGNISIKEVAASVGFSSAVFCRWFRNAVGASPSHYRSNFGLLRTP